MDAALDAKQTRQTLLDEHARTGVGRVALA
jgi:hypothetical protein